MTKLQKIKTKNKNTNQIHSDTTNSALQSPFSDRFRRLLLLLRKALVYCRSTFFLNDEETETGASYTFYNSVRLKCVNLIPPFFRSILRKDVKAARTTASAMT